MFWSGKTAVSLGLADRTGDLRAVLREKYGDKVRLKLFSTERTLLRPEVGRGHRRRGRRGVCRDDARRAGGRGRATLPLLGSDQCRNFSSIGAALVGGWYAWKVLKREMARVDREVEAVRKRPTETLERDPQTGKYKLKDKD